MAQCGMVEFHLAYAQPNQNGLNVVELYRRAPLFAFTVQ